MSEQLNVVLICVDQWRGDCLSGAGHPTVQTPYLDGLASEGVRFNRAYSATPVCIPARAALYTGLSQHTHGRVGYRDGVPWDYPVTLAGEFTRHGYQTEAVGKLHVHPARSQIGFQHVVLHDGFLHFARQHPHDYLLVDDYLPWLQRELGPHSGYGSDYFDHGLNCNSLVARPWDKPEYVHPTTFVVTQGLDFLRRRDPRKPFFLFLSFHRPHPPYDPPAWAFEQYLHQPMPDPPIGDWAEIFARHETARPDSFFKQVDPLTLRRARAGYYGHMTHIDHQINRFIEGLQDYGLHKNTVICFTSDHGEMMGDHHLFRKGYPYEGSARVPLILKAPERCGLVAGSQHNQPVELRDVMPTLLDCAGLPIPESVEGRSFLPLARGDAAANWRPYLQGELTMFNQSLQWVTDGHEKYIWMSGSGHEQFFDLDSDPQELHDLAREPQVAERLTHWRRALIHELRKREEGFTDGEQLIPGRPVTLLLKNTPPLSQRGQNLSGSQY